jgi:hypothetical protein
MIPLKKYQKLCAGDCDSREVALKHLLDAGLVQKYDQPDGSAVIEAEDESNPYVEAFFWNGGPGPDIILDWKQFSDEALQQFDKVLGRHGLQLISIEGPFLDSYYLRVERNKPKRAAKPK